MGEPLRRAVLVVLGGAAGLALGACEIHSSRPESGERRFVPRQERAAEPHAAAGRRGEVFVAWGAVAPDGAADVLVSVLGPAGELSAPARVQPAPGTAVAGRQVGPRLAVDASGRVLVSWVDRARDPAGDIAVAASADGGRTFETPVRVNDDAGLAGQEYHDLAVLAGGEVAAVWLDERDAPAGAPNTKQLYFALSADGGRSFAANVRLTSDPAGVCPCCRPGLAAADDGALHVACRERAGDALKVRVRTRRGGEAGFGPPVDVPGSAWRYPACPVDGPAIAAGPGADVFVAWKDGVAGREAVWLARSADGGRSFAPAGELAAAGPDPSAATSAALVSSARPALTADRRLGAVAAWEDGDGRLWARFLDGAAPGRPGAPFVVAGESPGGAARSPALAAAPDGIHIFWTEETVEEDAGGVTAGARLRHACLAPPDIVRLPGPATVTAGDGGSRPRRRP